MVTLAVSEVANLIGISERAVRKSALKGRYDNLRYIDGEKGGGIGGKMLTIPLTSLPSEYQLKYFEQQGTFDNPAKTVEPSEYGNAPEWARAKANQIFNILEALEKFIQTNAATHSRSQAIAEFIKLWNKDHEEQRVSRSSLLNWKKQLDTGGLAALLPKYGQNKGRQIGEGIQAEFYKLLKKKIKISECHRILMALAEKTGEYCPSLTTLKRIAKDIPEPVLVAMQEGRKAFYNKYQTFTKRDLDNLPARQVYVGDHRKFDFFIRSPRGTWVRPWITAWMDMGSGKLVSWVITFSPNTETITAAFVEAAIDPTIGLPREIYIDNGRDYCNERFAGRGFREKLKTTLDSERQKITPFMDTLGIKVHFAIPENARAKTIERVAFRNMSDWFCPHMDTYCGRNSAARPDDLTDKLKSNDPKYEITLDELKAIFDDYARKVYNKRKSQGKGRENECPDETFERKGLPVRVVSVDVLKHFLQKRTTRYKIGRNGITFKGEEYYHPDMSLHKGREVIISQRENDNEYIFVFDLDERPLFKARILESISATEATKEDMHNEGSRKGAEWKKVKGHKAYQMAMSGDAMSASEVFKLLGEYGDQAPDPKPTRTVEMVPTPARLFDAIRFNKDQELAATGTDGKRENIFELALGVKIEKRKA